MFTANIKSIKLKDKTKNLLSDIKFTLAPNNIYTITGNNGSGKSTLLFSIAGILSNEFLVDAEFILFGDNYNNLSKSEKIIFIRNNIRLVFQDPLSGFDPLKKIDFYFNLLSCEQEILEKELKYFLLPEYSELRKLMPYQLSVGMAQRLSILFAILSDPKFLILDEPTSSIDLPIANLLLLRLREFANNRDKIILLSTQDNLFANSISNFKAKMNHGKLTSFESISLVDK